ncbi:MAG: hypothetical protein AUG88_00700 [Actinobacteria bacterium 13_1_20CM_4_68_12]|nr:MAG: hypothetical protein AUG88_00700 [Actinobacteria bacterium 13_1_20CM_4_68_12]
MAGFDGATEVHRLAGDGARVSYRVEVDPDWRIGTKPNGGYLLAVLARAAVDAANTGAGAVGAGLQPHPIAASAHFLAAADAGPAHVEVEVLRRGRSASHLRASLHAGGRHCVEALVTCGRLPATNQPRWDDVPVPSLPADGWLRLADGRPPDPLSLLVAADCLPPATYDLGVPASWVPTIALAVNVRGIPAPGPLRARQRARLVTADQLDEQCEVWDSAGHLVAIAHQLAGIRCP